MQHNGVIRNDRFKLATPFNITKLNHYFDSESNTNQTNDDLDDVDSISKKCDKYTINGIRVVYLMSMSLFRHCLIEHFNIRFQRNYIIWPQRLHQPNYSIFIS